MSVLSIGSAAPSFVLNDALTNEPVSLISLLSRGPAILEFLRGTW